MKGKILVINPGSTSTKIALYEDGKEKWKENITHSAEELKKYKVVYQQLGMRTELVKQAAEKHGESLTDLAAVVSRGGPIARFLTGAYEVTPEMLEVAENRPADSHASSIGAAIAYNIARQAGIKAYIYDAVSADELDPLLRITGIKGIMRRAIGHNLNMRAAAIKYCEEQGWDYASRNIIVSHLGGGITTSLHSGGKIVDLINDAEGTFTPERAGLLPAPPDWPSCATAINTRTMPA